MKFRRFCTVFLLLALLLTQLWPVTAYAVEDIQLDAKAALLVDGATGTVLLDQDAHTKQYPASITKVMTALLVFEAIDRGELRLSDPITVSAGQQLGTITLSYGDVDYATVPLLAVADVNASRFLIVKQALKEFFSRTIVKVLMVVLVILVVLVLLFGKTVMRRRRYGSGRGRRRRHRSYRGRRF